MNSYERIYNLLLEEQRKPMTRRQKIGAGFLGATLSLGGGKATAQEPTPQPRHTYTHTDLPDGQEGQKRFQLDFGGTGKGGGDDKPSDDKFPSDKEKKVGGALVGVGLLARAIRRKRKDKSVERRLRGLEGRERGDDRRHWSRMPQREKDRRGL